MNRAILLIAAGLLAGCNTVPRQAHPDFMPSNSRISQPNTAPRGLEKFCRTYGQQTATSRAFSSAPDGKGTRGFDRASASVEGKRAYRRCLSGQTN